MKNSTGYQRRQYRIGATARLLCTCALALLLSQTAAAEERVAFTAEQGLDLARDAALVWSADAELVYLENDEPVGPDGTAERWGYLFHSPASGESRGYSLRSGKVLEAADLEFDFKAPPLPDQWLDSRDILAVAQQEVGRKYCERYQGRLSTMFLIRGAFHEKDPDRSTWTLVYTSATEPSLLVVIDAQKGKVVRKWKG